MGCGTSMSESQIIKQSSSPKKNNFPDLGGQEVKSSQELQHFPTQKAQKKVQSYIQKKQHLELKQNQNIQQKKQQNRVQTATTSGLEKQKQSQQHIEKVENFQSEELIQQQKIFQLVKTFLFGQSSQSQTRKIIQFDVEKLEFTLIASRTKKTQNTHKYQPQQIIFEESQQLQASSLYNKFSHPPYNFMFATYIEQSQIFLCGGVNANFQYISDEAFIYKIKKNQKIILSQNSIKPKQKGNNLLGLKFQRVPYMHRKRFSHMGVYLTIGKLNYVYVFGGRGEDDEILKHCQKYCFQQKKWTQISQMKNPRSTGFSLIFKSKIYVFGGYSGQKKRTKKIQIYDPIKNYWEDIDIKLHRGIQAGIVFSTKPNEILIMGGNMQLGSLKSVIKYNLADKTYIWDSNMKNQRLLQKGIKYKDQIYIFGGDFQQTFQKYSLKDRKWRDQKVAFGQLVSPDDINSYTFASQTIKVHFDQSNISDSTQEKQQSTNQFQKFYIFGNDNFPCILQINLSKWVLKKKAVPLSLRLRSYMGVVKIKQGKYFLCGGIDDFGEKSSKASYLYYGGTNKAIQVQKMKSKKYQFGICYHDDFVYIFGGKSQKDILSQSQRYNLKQQKWQQLPNLSRQRTKCKTLCLQHSILIIGGQDSLQSISQIEILNTKTKQFWVYHKTIPISSLIRGIFYEQCQNQFLIFSHNDLLGDDYCHRFNLNLNKQKIKNIQNEKNQQNKSQKMKTQEEDDIFACQLEFKQVNLKVLPFHFSFSFNQNFYFLTSKGLVNWKFLKYSEERDTMKPQIIINQVQMLQYPIQKFSFS